MSMDIGRIQTGRLAGMPEQTEQRRVATERATTPKPILDGGLSIRMGAYHAPGEVQGVTHVDEPSHEDKLGKLFGDLFDLAPPEMPNFV